MQMTVKKFHHLLKHTAVSCTTWFSDIKNIWLEEPWRGVEMESWAMSRGELQGGCAGTVWSMGALGAMAALQCN